MSGPCLCGDPYCGRCGNPALAELEAAEERLMELLANAKLTAEEYLVVASVGLAAVAQRRKGIAEALRNQAEITAEEY